MFKLITYVLDEKQEYEAESLDCALSLSIDAFNHNHFLDEIQENGKTILFGCQIYAKIKRAIY